jgi:mono/diheme cytochrome c family protein
MSEALSAASAALGIPEDLVQRSAAARATETGMSVDEVLAAWAGGGAIAAAPDTPPAESPEPEAQPDIEASDEPAPASPTIDTFAPTEPAITTRAPVPSEVSAAEAATLPEVVTVPTAGIRERTNFAIPRWLTAVMLIIPAFALFALGGAATGTCGEATELDANIVTGQIVNCDGSEFTGSGVSGGSTDFIAEGEAIYMGTGVSGVNCSGCHGVSGGGGAGPPLTAVVTTFGSCLDQVEWVTIGTPGFQAAGRSTFGDTGKPVGGGGVMPPHQSLSAEQVASVSAFERVRFDGADPETTLTDCGLAPEEGSEGGETEDEDGDNEQGTTDETPETDESTAANVAAMH